jgi:hypothetical protein
MRINEILPAISGWKAGIVTTLEAGGFGDLTIGQAFVVVFGCMVLGGLFIGFALAVLATLIEWVDHIQPLEARKAEYTQQIVPQGRERVL